MLCGLLALPITWGFRLLMTPFIAVGIYVLVHGAFLSIGRIEVRVTRDGGEMFSGVGPFGRRRRFDPAEVQSVGMKAYNRYIAHHAGATTVPMFRIEITGPWRTIRFGDWMSSERRRWVTAVVRERLVRCR